MVVLTVCKWWELGSLCGLLYLSFSLLVKYGKSLDVLSKKKNITVVHWRANVACAARHCTVPMRWSEEGARGRSHGGARRPCSSGRCTTGARVVLAAKRSPDELGAVVAEAMAWARAPWPDRGELWAGSRGL